MPYSLEWKQVSESCRINSLVDLLFWSCSLSTSTASPDVAVTWADAQLRKQQSRSGYLLQESEADECMKQQLIAEFNPKIYLTHTELFPRTSLNCWISSFFCKMEAQATWSLGFCSSSWLELSGCCHTPHPAHSLMVIPYLAPASLLFSNSPSPLSNMLPIVNGRHFIEDAGIIKFLLLTFVGKQLIWYSLKPFMLRLQ